MHDRSDRHRVSRLCCDVTFMSRRWVTPMGSGTAQAHNRPRWQSCQVAEQDGLPFEEREALRREEAKWWIAHAREALAAGGRRYESRADCPDCGTRDAALIPRNGQNTVRCARCGRLLYNAPKTETGEVPRTALTLRQDIKASQQARILDRDHARCVLCGRGDVPLSIGHLLSVQDGLRLGATAEELQSDENLAAMCEACNLGLSSRSVSPATYARIMLHLIRAKGKQDETDQIEVDGSTRMPNLVKASSQSSAETTSSP